MKALVYKSAHTLEICQYDRPIVNSGASSREVLIKVESVGICGSDMHAFLGHDDRRPAPLILGHEAAGVVVEGELEGMRVTVNPLVTCGKCNYCLQGKTNLCPRREIISMPPREGAFAEYLTMPVENLVEVPSNITSQKACMAEPIACGWHAIKEAFDKLGITKNYDADNSKLNNRLSILVIGGGAIGTGAALSAQAQFADLIDKMVIVESNDLRREYIQNHIDFTVNTVVKSPDELSEGDVFDIVVDGVGFETTRSLACAKTNPGGVIVHIGLGSSHGGVDVRRLTLQEITFLGTYTYTKQDFIDTANAIFSGDMGDLGWVETMPLNDGQQAFDKILKGQIAAPKVLLLP